MKQRYKLEVLSTLAPFHPMAKEWPKRFEGSYKEYSTFTTPLDIRPLLQKNQMIMVSRWANAVIDQYFLPYNFFPKYNWPDRIY